jgi:hypothetical protein
MQLLDWHFPYFCAPRLARGLLTDAIIPLSVAVAKVEAANNPLKILMGLRQQICHAPRRRSIQ